MPVDQGQPNAALSSLSNAAEESEEQQANDGLDAEEESTDRVEEAVAAAAGVAVTYGLVELTVTARSVLILIGLALFIAAGLDPGVTWLERHRFPRWAAVLTVLLVLLAVLGGFVAAAIPPLVAQARAPADHLPRYAHSLQNHNSELGKLNVKYHLPQRD